MICKAEAIIMRLIPYSRSSVIVSYLAKEHGRINAIAKGAHRPHSWLLGQMDLFYSCEMVWYQNTRSGLHILKECSPLSVRSYLRTSWKAFALASFLTDSAWRCLFPALPNDGILNDMRTGLDALQDNPADWPLLFWFELRLFSSLGVQPRFSCCAACGKPCNHKQATYLSAAAGGAVCQHCHHPGDTRTVGPDIIALLATWSEASDAKKAMRTRCTYPQAMTISRWLGDFWEYHFDSAPVSRAIAVDLMTR